MVGDKKHVLRRYPGRTQKDDQRWPFHGGREESATTESAPHDGQSDARGFRDITDRAKR